MRWVSSALGAAACLPVRHIRCIIAKMIRKWALVQSKIAFCLALEASACSGRLEQLSAAGEPAGAGYPEGPSSEARANAGSGGEVSGATASAGYPGTGNADLGSPTFAGPEPTLRTTGTLSVLSTAPKFPVSLATYAGNVYFVDWGTYSNDGAVYGLDAHGVQLFRVDNLQGPGGIAADAQGVYWAALHDLARADLDGSHRATLSHHFVNDPIALGPGAVYGTGALDDMSGGILSVSFDGGPTELLTPNEHASYGVAADAHRVYWTTFSDPMSILTVPLDGGARATQVLATSPGVGGGIAIDAHNVYWVAQGAVMKAPIGGGAPTQIASSAPPGFISGIAVDGTSVYWSTADSIMKVSVDGGPPEILATGQDVPSAVAVDETSVYWTNVGNPTGIRGSISRLTPK